MAEDQGAEKLRQLLDRIVDELDLDASIDVTDDGETITGTLEGDELGLFIGRHGSTIEAVQHLAQRVAGGEGAERRRVVVDAAGYRGRRAEVLQRQADEAADGALSSGRPVALDAMTSSERRVVHEYLRDRGDVDTHSEGDEPHRHLVISPKSD
jgi:spoIIIJ-associated protein